MASATEAPDRRAYYRRKSRQYRRDHPDYWNKRIRVARDFVDEYKSQPCTDCGVEYPPPVMELDHVRGERKKMSVAQMAHAGYSVTTIKKEIEKCDVRCANCHRLRHLEEGWK